MLRTLRLSPLLALLTTACSSSTPAETPAPFTLTPTEADVATCRTKVFVATPADGVTWALTGAGSLASGTYTAPLAVPTPATAQVKATRGAASATASVRLATAFPEAGKDVTGKGTSPLIVHATAARGARVYALTQDGAGAFVSTSTDGGLTFGARVAVGGERAASIAVDAGSDDIVYVTLHRGDAEAYGALFLATSTDGGKTFTEKQLYQGGNGDVSLADVSSPAAGTVVVAAPAPWQDGAGGQGSEMLVFVDKAKGAGFPALSDLANGYAAKAASPKVIKLTGNNLVESGDGLFGPHLATNGAGKVCLVFAEYGIDGSEERHLLRCSSDGGATFGAPVTVAHGPPDHLSRPRVAIGKDGKLVVVAWNAFASAVDTIGTTQYAVSTDGGLTFGAAKSHPGATFDGAPAGVDLAEVLIDDAGVLWFARGVAAASVVVDKSCDQGATLSGAIALPITGTHRYPTLFASSAGIFAGAHVPDTAALRVLRLLPN